MQRTIELASALLLTLLFFVSGIYKLTGTDAYVDVLRKRVDVSPPIARFLIICAALLQIVGPLVVVAHQVLQLIEVPQAWLQLLALASAVALVLFTILATVLFKVPTFNAQKPWPLLSNVSIAGGLVLLSSALARG